MSEENPVVGFATPNIAGLFMKVPDFLLGDEPGNPVNKTDEGTTPTDAPSGEEEEEEEGKEEPSFTFEVDTDENGNTVIDDTTTTQNTTDTSQASTTVSPDIAKLKGKIAIPMSTFKNISNKDDGEKKWTGTISIMTYDKPTLFRQVKKSPDDVEQKIDSVIVSVSLGKDEEARGNPAIKLDFVKKNATAKNVVYSCTYWKGSLGLKFG